MALLIASPYDIGRFSGRCAITDREFAPGEPVVAALTEREGDDGFDRLDFCPEAWAALSPDERRAFRGRPLFAFWRATSPTPDVKARQFIDDDALIDLWEQMVETSEQPGEDARAAGFRYILTLILCRKRVLVHERSEHATPGLPGALFVRRRTRADEPSASLIRVTDPGLDVQTIAGATEHLSAALRGEW